MVQIDDMPAIEACYAFAGVVGVHPRGLTLCQLWKMANGKIRALRYHQVGQATMVWGGGEIDPILYAEYGKADAASKGKPLEYSAEMQAEIEAKVAKIYKQNPELLESTKYGKG